MQERNRVVAGLDTCMIEGVGRADLLIVVLHGYGMRAVDLVPFAHSLGIPRARFAFPQAPTEVAAGGFTWWSIDADERAAKMRVGARDFADEDPRGRAQARRQIRDLLTALRAEAHERVLLAGFSQGGMLACDTLLCEDVPLAAMAMMSASRVAIGEWQERTLPLRDMPVFVSHGRSDPDLAFSAGCGLEQFLRSNGARVSWFPFDGGHEIPFSVWREFRRFVRDMRSDPAAEQHVHYGTH